MTNQEIYQIALQQSAYDSGCAPEDFLKEKNVVVESKTDARARRYLTLPFDCDLVSYGGNIVASVRGDMTETVRAYIDRYPAEHCFETPNLHILNDELQTRGLRVCFMAEYFLPDLDKLCALPCTYETRVLGQPDFAGLYADKIKVEQPSSAQRQDQSTWGNALCEKRRELDVLGVGAYDGDKLIGLAACSADCDTMWQIGVDVLPEYRKKGIASALTARLAMEILARGKVPFYCAAWSNIKSVRNAIRSGFRPAWVELTAKSAAFVEEMNTGEEE